MNAKLPRASANRQTARGRGREKRGEGERRRRFTDARLERERRERRKEKEKREKSIFTFLAFALFWNISFSAFFDIRSSCLVVICITNGGGRGRRAAHA